MAVDLYASCPCGSGKKFKWCCLPIYADVNKARELESAGQHEQALKTMQSVTERFPTNPEAWGCLAELYLVREKPDKAELALQKAFDLNPHYPRGLLLRAGIRLREGEFTGALILARKAAEAFPPEALDNLAAVYDIIFRCEMDRNRPVAARAALKILMHCQPADTSYREAMETFFGPRSRFPEAARREYTFLPPRTSLAPERRHAWDQALATVSGPRLGALAQAFEDIVARDPQDAAAWFNLTLTRAWLGDNRKALEALDRYLELESEEARLATAGALGEVLRFGHGLDDFRDHHLHVIDYQIRDPQMLGKFLEEKLQKRLLVPVPAAAEHSLVALILEPKAPALVTSSSDTPQADRRLGGYLHIAGDRMRLTSPMRDRLHRFRDELRQQLPQAIHEHREIRDTPSYSDVLSEALFFPADEDKEKYRARVLEHAQQFLEETWVHRPLASLKGKTPLEASQEPLLRRRLLGLIQFLQECAALGVLHEYDFHRLRRKLGLLAPSPEEAGKLDILAMAASELAGLNAEELSDEQLEQACQTAQKLDASDQATRFARTLVTRPPHGDRYPWYSYLILQALKEGNPDTALEWVDAAMKYDCEHNEGRRRNDLELRRGQVLAKRGDADAAHDVFTRLIERVPDNLRIRGSAIEAMLSLRQGARAVALAEGGLTEARKQQNRDSEAYMEELLAAAKKLQ